MNPGVRPELPHHALPHVVLLPPTGRRMRLQGCCHPRKAGVFANSHPSTGSAASTSGGEGGRRLAHERAPVRRRRCSPSAIGLPLLLCCLHRRCRHEATRPRAHLSACLLSSWARAVRVRRRLAPPCCQRRRDQLALLAPGRNRSPLDAFHSPPPIALCCAAPLRPSRAARALRRLPWRQLCDCVCVYCVWGNAGNAGDAGTRGVH